MDRNMNQCAPCQSKYHMDDMDMPGNMTVGMAYVPWQKFYKTYDPRKALHAGTIFPELDKPFTGKCVRGGGNRW